VGFICCSSKTKNLIFKIKNSSPYLSHHKSKTGK
jgi:hypothetical protein